MLPGNAAVNPDAPATQSRMHGDAATAPICVALTAVGPKSQTPASGRVGLEAPRCRKDASPHEYCLWVTGVEAPLILRHKGDSNHAHLVPFQDPNATCSGQHLDWSCFSSQGAGSGTSGSVGPAASFRKTCAGWGPHHPCASG